MPCDSVATIACKLDIPLKELIAFPGSLDALAAGLKDTSLAVEERRGSLCLTKNGIVVAQLAAGGEVTGSYARMLRDLVESTMPLILMTLVGERIKANALRVTDEQWVDNMLVLSLDL